MPSGITLAWASAGAAALVVAAGGGALYWTHPSSLFGDGPALVAARTAQPPPARAEPPLTTAAASSPAGEEVATSAPTAAVKPAFDVVSVEPTGDAVIAGRAAPHAKVELRDAGRMVAEATTDDTGQFVIIPPTLAPGGHNLSLTADDGQSGEQTSNVVAVSVPAREAKPAVVAASPAQPAAAASTSDLVAPPASGSADLSRVAIRSIEANAGGGLVARGSAGPNAIVRIYLNGVDVADAKTKTDGQWSLTIRRGLTGGAYVVRADEVSSASADAKVLAHAETPFEYAALPASTAAPAKTTPPQVATAAPEGLSPVVATADPVVDSMQTTLVARGHTLWTLSRNYYGDPTRYPLIYETNKAQIHNPNLIYPGQVLVVPKFEPKP